MDSILVLASLYALWRLIRIIQESLNSRSQAKSKAPRVSRSIQPLPTPISTPSTIRHSKPVSKPIEKKQPIRQNKTMPKSDGTKEGMFWARVNENPNGCWVWNGSVTTDFGYAQMFWEGSPRPAHRIAWQIVYGSMPDGDFLINTCGLRTCVNPEHYEIKRRQERKCISENCEGISLSTTQDGYCAQCKRRRRYEYRKTRPNPFTCTSTKCSNPSGTVAFASLCMSCRRKEAKGR
jgi:hypothetical protein